MNKAKAFRLAAKLGAEIDVTSLGDGCFDACVDAPHGKLWSCSDTHAFVINNETEPDASAAQFWQGMIEEMNEGLYDCTDPECEVCRPVGGEYI